MLKDILNSGDCCLYSLGVSHRVGFFMEGNIEVHPNENAFVFKVEFFNREFVGYGHF